MSANHEWEKEEPTRRADNRQRLLAGEPLPNNSTDVRRQHIQRELFAIDDAIRDIDQDVYRERDFLAIHYCKTLEPKEAALMSKTCKSAAEFHESYTALYGMKRHLIDNGIGLRNICLTLPDFLGPADDRGGAFASWFREAKRKGYTSDIPVELR
jgi:hypothetical protein